MGTGCSKSATENIVGNETPPKTEARANNAGGEKERMRISESESVSAGEDVAGEAQDELGFPKSLGPPKPFAADAPASPEYLARFGESESIVLENPNTILFVGGRYVDAPHAVQSRGLGVFVNNELVFKVPWPSGHYVAERPQLPDHIDANSTFDDLGRGRLPQDNWCHNIHFYLTSHVPPEEITTQLLEAYRQLPFVVSVTPEDLAARPVTNDDFGGGRQKPGYVMNTTSGESRRLVPGAFRWEPPAPKQLVQKWMTDFATQHAENIARDGWIIYGKHSRRTITPDSPRWWYLPTVVEVLDSKSDRYNKIRKLWALLRQEFPGRDEPEPDHHASQLFAEMVDSYQPSPQLRKRVAAIRADWERRGRTPDIPELPRDEPQAPSIEEREAARQRVTPENEFRKDLKATVDQIVRMLEEGDFETYLMEYQHPSRRPETDNDLQRKIEARRANVELSLMWFRRMQNQTPWMSDDGRSAVFSLFAVGEFTGFKFTKIGEFWYYGG